MVPGLGIFQWATLKPIRYLESITKLSLGAPE